MEKRAGPFTLHTELEPQLQLRDYSKNRDEYSGSLDRSWHAGDAPERGLCDFRNITIENVQIVNARHIFAASGLPEKPITNVKFANVNAQGLDAGSIDTARD